MADAEVQLVKGPLSKTPTRMPSANATSKENSKETDPATVSLPKEATTSSEGRRPRPQTSKTTPLKKTGNVDLNSEVLSVLKELNSNLNRQGSKLESLAKKVDELYEPDDYYEPDEDCYVEDFYEPSQHTETQSQDDLFSTISNSEPPPKKQCLENDIFKDLCDKYQSREKCDSEINENLASFINSSFRNGLSDETVVEMLKDIHRPSNCEALAKTKVNPSMWRLLKPQTQSEDIKFQNLQNTLVKATSNMSKLLDKESVHLDSQSREWGTTAVALLGQCFKMINNKRKECHRADLDPRFYPLTSSSQPYTEHLYGDDINKNVRDIQDMSKLGKDVGRSQPQNQNRGNSYRRRAGRRGQVRGRGRGLPQKQSDAYAQPKNSRGGYKKQF